MTADLIRRARDAGSFGRYNPELMAELAAALEAHEKALREIVGIYENIRTAQSVREIDRTNSRLHVAIAAARELVK
jgi:hypothetical protein